MSLFVQLQIRPIEAKLLTLALDPVARGNEISTSAEKLIRSLRARGVLAADVFAPIAVNGNGAMARAAGTRMPFGKYKGQQLSEIPLSYLRWAKNNCVRMSHSLRAAISTILEESA